MNKLKLTSLTKKELFNINGGNVKFVSTSTSLSYYPTKWGKNLGKWISSKVK